MSGAHDWDHIAEWWVAEVAAGRGYDTDVLPMVSELLGTPSGRVVDLGCGEGQAMRLLGPRNDGIVLGCDLSAELLQRARRFGPVVRCELPHLAWLRDGVAAAAFSIFVLDLIEDHVAFFSETARIVAPGGSLVVVINHPTFTAPGSVPLIDDDGRVLWRWGEYFTSGTSTEPAGGTTLTFHHRPMSGLLTAAARAGWALERLEERGLEPEAIARDPGYAGQEGIPRVLGARWRRS